MRLHDAFEQLDVIHDYLARAEVYRGFTVPGVALVGGLGLLAPGLQPILVVAESAESFVWYWLAVAAVAALLGFGAALQAYFLRDDAVARRKNRRVFAQFLPSLAGGGLITAAFARGGWDLVAFLPGLWAIAFGLGIVAARPYLPRGIGYVGLAYLLSGGLLLTKPFITATGAGWSISLVFGVGHLLTAAVLHWDRPRDAHG
jgi:hypothetical protein